MKKLSLLGLSLVILLASCVKDPKPAPVGPATVRAINAVQGSVDQDFFINHTKRNTTPIAYGNATEYFDITSGGNELGFTDVGTTNGNAGDAFNIPINTSSSAYFFKALTGNVSMDIIPDNTAAPESGKAKVRFIHLNNFLDNSIAVSIADKPLITALGFGVVSDYYSVDPGTKFTVSGTGVTNAPEIDPVAVEGKIYTIWIGGTAGTELIGHVVLQN